MRRISLDQGTVELLATHRLSCEERMAALDLAFAESAFVFSYEPDHSRPCNPDGISHRYAPCAHASASRAISTPWATTRQLS